MPDLDLEPGPKKPDTLTIVSTLIAAAIVIPIGWWVKDTGVIAYWVNALFTR